MVKIIKETLKVLSEKNLLATPKNYANEFYKQCNTSNIVIDDIVELNKLVKTLSYKEKKDLNKTKMISYYEISKILSTRFKDSEVKRFVHHLENFLKPSLDQKILKDIEKFIKELSLNPKGLTTDLIIKELSELTKTRITNDRNVIIEKSNDISKIASLLGKYFDSSLKDSENSMIELSKIKDELTDLNLSTSSQREITSLQSKLINTVYDFENTLEKNNSDLKKGQDSYKVLEDELKELKDTLKKVENEKNIDFLTGISNRRSFTDEVKKIEYKFFNFEQKYALVFFDIDFFKKINDQYGHNCGDSVIATFASILTKLTRVNDVVSRYGGEEFVALINYSEKTEIEKYIKRVKSIVAQNSFIYKDLKFKIKFSAGVSYRDSYQTFDAALEKADKLLYIAKNSGRDKIVFDTDVIL